MNNINKEAQQIIDRIKIATEKNPPKFNLEKITQAFEKQYSLLGVPMPKIEVAPDMVLGYKIAWDAARAVARAVAWAVAWDAAWAAARAVAWDAALMNTGLNDKDIIRFFEIEIEMLKALENGLGWYFPMKDKLILVPMPKLSIEKLTNGVRLHSLEKPAVIWKNNTQFYFIHGVRFEEDLWKRTTKGQLTFKEIMGLRNMEQRMIALKLYGTEKLLVDSKAELVEKVRGYELYKFTKVFPTDEYAIKYSCPSTGREYLSFIPPEIGSKGNVIDGMRWKFYLDDKEDYSFEAES